MVSLNGGGASSSPLSGLLDRAAFGLLLLLAALISFEPVSPILEPLPGLGLTTMKLHIVLIVGLAAASALLRGDLGSVLRLPLARPALALAAAFVLSAGAAFLGRAGAPAAEAPGPPPADPAPEPSAIPAPRKKNPPAASRMAHFKSPRLADPRTNGLKFALRWLAGTLLFLAAARLLRDERRRRAAVLALLAGGALALLAAAVEAAAGGRQSPLLAPFQEDITWYPSPVGSFRRLQGSFSHANVLGGFLAILVPLAAAALSGGRAVPRLLGGAALAAAGAGLVLTVSRGALLAATAGVAALLVLAGRSGTRPKMRAPCAAFLFAALAAAFFHEPWRQRIGLGQRPLHAGTIEAPARLTLAPAERRAVTVKIRPPIEGVPPPAVIGWVWKGPLDGEGGGLRREQYRQKDLEGVEEAGGRLAYAVPLRAPRLPGRYEATLAVTLAGRGFFDPWRRFLSRMKAEVEGPPPPPPRRGPGPARPAPHFFRIEGEGPGRADYFAAAVRIFLERPLLGAGPDNFRLLHGGRVGQGAFDARAHAHNLYLEFLADLGAIGAAAFAAFTFALLRRAWRGASPGLFAALLVFHLHGLVDYLLMSTPLQALYFLLAALAAAGPGAAPAGSPRAPEGPERD